MKTYKNLWDEFISRENFELAADRALRGKKSKRSAIRFMKHRERKLESLRQSLINGTFTTGRYRQFTIYEPKQRQIYMLPLYPDHILHHALMNVLAPIWQKMFIYDSYACIPGRGLHPASRRCAEMARKYKYVLQCDVRKFYPSINHDVMMNIIRRKISDRRLVAVLENIVRSMPGPCGMPIGNLTSQWMGNLFLNDLDMFVKHTLRIKNYIRYCDDFCIFGNDKRKLKQWREILRLFLCDKLKLYFSRAFIKPTIHGINFIGYKHFPKYVTLTNMGAKKMRRNMMDMLNASDPSDITRSQIASLSGWLRWAKCKNLRKTFLKQTFWLQRTDIKYFLDLYD